ncbi:MAG: 2-hydroxychromene-2-carboxylate isomerase [Acidiferrobacterales bacterium]
MSKTVDYYFSPVSPFTYLGGDRFAELTRELSVTVNVCPVDMQKLFAATGGLPLKQRSAERRAYRLVELARWRDSLGIPLNLEPKYFPANDRSAALMIIAAREQGLDALALSQRLLRAVWTEERNIADADTLVELANSVGLDGRSLLESAQDPAVAEMYDRDTETAIKRGVFAVPTYVVDGEIFWGQDRLDFVARKLRASQ